jgi:HK97 family phage portal protein
MLPASRQPRALPSRTIRPSSSATSRSPAAFSRRPARSGDDTAARLKEAWDTKFSGDNAGKVAVLGDGLKYERMALTAEESQLIDQLKWTAEVVCSVFHVPSYKIGVGQMPTYSNIQSLNVEYYSQCLQSLIESAELCLDEGLGIGEGVWSAARPMAPSSTLTICCGWTP